MKQNNDSVLIWNKFNSKEEFTIKYQDRSRHMLILWQTWTWKTNLMMSLALEDMKNWKWVWFIDPHWDWIDNVVKYIPKDRIKDLVILDVWNRDIPFWFNILSTKNDNEKIFLCNEIIELFKEYYNEISLWSPRLEDYFRNWLLTLIENNWRTILDLLRLFKDLDFQNELVSNIQNPITKTWWKNIYAKSTNNEINEIISEISQIMDMINKNDILVNIIWQENIALDFNDIFQNQKILLINLSKWKIWEFASKFIWRMVLSHITMSAFRNIYIDYDSRIPFFLYIDEFQLFVNPSIEILLSEWKKYWLNLTFSNQYLSQLDYVNSNENISPNINILWNVWSIISFKVWQNDAEYLSKILWLNYKDEDLSEMENYTWIARISENGKISKAEKITIPNISDLESI